jgi:quercetin dioxygenase-like cupin family protein
VGAGPEPHDTLELHYTLCGAGSLLGANGTAQPVGPGDSIISAQGAALFTVPAGAADAGGVPAPLVMLQVLLPGKLLRDAAGGLGTAHTDPADLLIRPEWSCPTVLKAGRVSQELMCSLLSRDMELTQGDGHGGDAAAPGPGDGESAAPSGSSDPAAPAADVTLEPLAGSRPLHKRSLSGVRAWQLPNATNQLALVFGPHLDPELSMTFGVEMFEPGHRTTRHIHTSAYEMFVVLGGQGVGISNGEEVPIRAGDVAVFPPYVVHAIDNTSDRRLYCLQVGGLRRAEEGGGRGWGAKWP